MKNLKNLFAEIRDNPQHFIDTIEEIVDLISDCIDSYSEAEVECEVDTDESDPDDNDVDCTGCLETSCPSHPKYNDSILINNEGPVPIYGERWEVIDALPSELGNIITFVDGGVQFGKTNLYDSVKEFIDDSARLSKRIRPSRGNLTAPQFRALVEEWRTNMINDAKSRNNINLNI